MPIVKLKTVGGNVDFSSTFHSYFFCGRASLAQIFLLYWMRTETRWIFGLFAVLVLATHCRHSRSQAVAKHNDSSLVKRDYMRERRHLTLVKLKSKVI